MKESPYPTLPKSPIVELVVDFDCDMPPGFDLAAQASAAQRVFESAYPVPEERREIQHFVHQGGDATASLKTQTILAALQYFAVDRKQLVQIRPNGFSFNRMAPYAGFTSLCADLARDWSCYRELIGPVMVRIIRMRAINRIHLPATDSGVVMLGKYLMGFGLPGVGQGLVLHQFMQQYLVIETESGMEAQVTLMPEPTTDGSRSLILDLTVGLRRDIPPEDWDALRVAIGGLRNLRNQVFFGSLSPACLELFQ